METAWIGLGGNVGDVEATFDGALARLDAHAEIRVVARSRVHGTKPIGADAGPAFRNMAAGIETTLDSYELLLQLHEVEAEFGRVRKVVWGPRTLDLDLLLHGDRIVADDRLVVPHPATWYRRFVLDPLAEIAADVVHPERGVTIGELRERLQPRPLPIAIVGGTDRERAAVVSSLRDRFGGELAFVEVGDEPPIVAWLGGPGFDACPSSRRLDASTADEPAEFLGNVVAAALG